MIEFASQISSYSCENNVIYVILLYLDLYFCFVKTYLHTNILIPRASKLVIYSNL